jgi:hypothetical protein
MIDDERNASLRTIAIEAQRLRTLAHNAKADMLAYLLENVVHEARAELVKTGASPEPEPPQGGNVVRLR